MSALVVHSTHELHQLKKALPRRQVSLVINMNYQYIEILFIIPMRLSAPFCGRAHFVCSKNFLKKFPKIFGIFSKLRITPRKGGSTTNFQRERR